MTRLNIVRVTGHQTVRGETGACTCGWTAPTTIDGKALTLSMRVARLRDHKLAEAGVKPGTVTRIYPVPEIPNGAVTARHLAEKSGITYRQLDFWTRTGRLHPINPGTGPGYGHDRYYPPTEVEVATYTRRLLNAGVQLNTALDAARALAEGQVVSLADGLITIKDQT